MRIVAIIQARVGSSRLPGKVLQPIGGRTMLELVVDRTRAIAGVSEVVVATTENIQDDPIAALCQQQGISLWRGSEEDVLERYYQAAIQFQADAILRVTSDCPLIDPEVCSRLLAAFSESKADYASNNNPPSFPHGLDAEVMTFEALRKAHEKSGKSHQREHVTYYMIENPEEFETVFISCDENLSHLRVTVDQVEDLNLVRQIVDRFGPNLNLQDIRTLAQSEPEIFNQNLNAAHVYREKVKADLKSSFEVKGSCS
jgi:spore coat polysaccharide biosynthesis protein SpsF